MTADIYTLTFLEFHQSDNPVFHKELMLKSTLTFFMQITLIFMVRHEQQGFSGIFLGDVYLNSARIICCILLHLNIIPEILDGINLMRFAKDNGD